MLYAIISEDKPDSLQRRMAARPAHLGRLQALQDDSEDPGEAGFSGSLVVAEFDDLQNALIWAEADPYIEADVYAKVTVKPFRKVLP